MENNNNSPTMNVNQSQQSSSPMSNSSSQSSCINYQNQELNNEATTASYHTSHVTFTSIGLRSIEEIPVEYRHVFSEYPSFNAFQSKVMDEILYSDKSVVVSAPTGSGKTVVFELAIINLLVRIKDIKYTGKFMIVYMAPMKALCTERMKDWEKKFSPLGLICQEVTGDSNPTFEDISSFNVVLTTPEKWDSLTRAWKDNKTIVQTIKLFLLDEVHLLNDEKRGPVLEAVISRMKTIQDMLSYMNHQGKNSKEFELPVSIRFIAVSATIPNVEDVALWLGGIDHPATYFKLGEEFRPVKLQKVVMGYPCPVGTSLFRFELQLNYKLRQLLFQYSEGRPSLIFCSTRKGVMQTGDMLRKQITFHFNDEQKMYLSMAIGTIKENMVKKCLEAGVGCHHAGMDVNDRHVIEDLFRSGGLPVLITTSTLSMGVNLPAHLVIIKSTQQYTANGYQEYSSNQILQMIGRAGRPQYDTCATAVIMTHKEKEEKYRKLVTGTDILESSLHRHLAEHLNSEVVLSTITEKAVAINWVRSTFLYIRALCNPVHYGISANLTKQKIEDKLQEMCLIEMNALANYNIVKLDIMDVWPTDIGKLMAQHYMSFETMKIFTHITGKETLSDVLKIIASCHEFSDCKLRTSEKKSLNLLNKSLRFPLQGLIKTLDMKVNCLVQAMFGGLMIQEPSLQQEAVQIIRIGSRVTKCLTRYLRLQDKFKSLLSATTLEKCFQSNLWENSPFVSRQLAGIGAVLSQLLVSAGKSSFQSIAESNPRDLERIINRAPPMGNRLQSAALHMPHYSINTTQVATKNTTQLYIQVSLDNYGDIRNFSTPGFQHSLVIIAGDSDNKLLLYVRFHDTLLINNMGSYTWLIEVDNEESNRIYIHLISEKWVGMDVRTYINPNSKLSHSPLNSTTCQTNTKRTIEKSDSTTKKNEKNKPKKQKLEKVSSILHQLQKASSKFVNATGTKKLSLKTERKKKQVNIKDYLFTPKQKNKLIHTEKENIECSTSILQQTTSHLNHDMEIHPFSNDQNSLSEISTKLLDVQQDTVSNVRNTCSVKKAKETNISESQTKENMENISTSKFIPNILINKFTDQSKCYNENIKNENNGMEDFGSLDSEFLTNRSKQVSNKCVQYSNGENEHYINLKMFNNIKESLSLKPTDIDFSPRKSYENIVVNNSSGHREIGSDSSSKSLSPSSISSLAAIIAPNCANNLLEEDNIMQKYSQTAEESISPIKPREISLWSNAQQSVNSNLVDTRLTFKTLSGHENESDILNFNEEEKSLVNNAILFQKPQNVPFKCGYSGSMTSPILTQSEHLCRNVQSASNKNIYLSQSGNSLSNHTQEFARISNTKLSQNETNKKSTENDENEHNTIPKEEQKYKTELFTFDMNTNNITQNELSENISVSNSLTTKEKIYLENQSKIASLSESDKVTILNSTLPMSFTLSNSQCSFTTPSMTINDLEEVSNSESKKDTKQTLGNQFLHSNSFSVNPKQKLLCSNINFKYRPIFQNKVAIITSKFNSSENHAKMNDTKESINSAKELNQLFAGNSRGKITFDIGIDELIEPEECFDTNNTKQENFSSLIYSKLKSSKDIAKSKKLLDFTDPIIRILYGTTHRSPTPSIKQASVFNVPSKYFSNEDNESLQQISKQNNSFSTFRNFRCNLKQTSSYNLQKGRENDIESEFATHCKNCICDSDHDFVNDLTHSKHNEQMSFLTMPTNQCKSSTLDALEFLHKTIEAPHSSFGNSFDQEYNLNDEDCRDIFADVENYAKFTQHISFNNFKFKD